MPIGRRGRPAAAVPTGGFDTGSTFASLNALARGHHRLRGSVDESVERGDFSGKRGFPLWPAFELNGVEHFTHVPVAVYVAGPCN